MSSSASYSTAASKPANAGRWNKKSSDDGKTVIARPPDNEPPLDEDGSDQGGEDVNPKSHAGVPTPSDFLGPDLPGKVTEKVLAAITSRDEADKIKKHGLRMLLLCAEASDAMMRDLEGNSIYKLLATIGAKGEDNRKEISRLLVDK